MWEFIEPYEYSTYSEWTEQYPVFFPYSMDSYPRGNVHEPEGDSCTALYLTVNPESQSRFDYTPTDTSCQSEANWTNSLVPDEDRYTCRERRRRKRASAQYRRAHAARERLRVEAFNQAFSQLRTLLPMGLAEDNAPHSERRLSKLQILRLCSTYIFRLTQLLHDNPKEMNQPFGKNT